MASHSTPSVGPFLPSTSLQFLSDFDPPRRVDPRQALYRQSFAVSILGMTQN